MRLPDLPRSLALVFQTALLAAQSVSPLFADGVISTVAGGGPHEAPASSASIGCAEAVATDDDGNLYFTTGGPCVTSYCQGAQTFHRVYKVDPAGVIRILAGRGPATSDGDGGPALLAGLNPRLGIAADAGGNVYVSDTHRVRRIDAVTGIITTVAGTGVMGFGGDGGPAVDALLSGPGDLELGPDGSLYLLSNGRVRRVDAVTGVISTVAGGGTGCYSGEGVPATSTGICATGIDLDASGNIFIAQGVDSNNNRVRRVDAATGLISTVAGSGPWGSAGDGGPAVNARLRSPQDVVVNSQGDLFIADGGGRIRRVSAATGLISTAFVSNFLSPFRLTLNVEGKLVAPQGGYIYIVNPATGTFIRTVGNGLMGFSGDGGPAIHGTLINPSSVVADAAGNIFILDPWHSRVRKVDPTGFITSYAGGGSGGDGVPAVASALHYPSAVAATPDGDLLIAEMADCEGDLGLGNAHKVRKVDAASGLIETVAGTGTGGYNGDGIPAATASLNFPWGMATDAAGNIFIADAGNFRIRRVDAATGLISTVAGDGTLEFDGDGQPATQAALGGPADVDIAMNGDLFIAEEWNHRVRKVDFLTGLISTIAGTGVAGNTGDGGPATSALLDRPVALALSDDGRLFIGDAAARIRRVDLATGIITTIAGDGVAGFSGDGGPAEGARVGPIWGLAVDADGNLYAADKVNNRVRKISAEPSAAGAIPDGSDPRLKPLTLEHLEGGILRLSWGSSCVTSDEDYVVYRGVLGDYDSHLPMTCSTGGATALTIPATGSSAYYLVVPRNPLQEGSYGTASNGTPRPPSTNPCLPQSIAPCGAQGLVSSLWDSTQVSCGDTTR